MYGYHKLKIRLEDVPNSEFRTHYGMTNAPATFMSLINGVFKVISGFFCYSLIDDIIVYSKSKEGHDDNLHIVLGVLVKQKFYAKLSMYEYRSIQMPIWGI